MDLAIEIRTRDNTEGDRIKHEIEELGYEVDKVEFSKIYLLLGVETKEIAIHIAEEILVDNVWETYEIREYPFKPQANELIIAYNPGVMDPVANTARTVIHECGYKVEEVKVMRKYRIHGIEREAITRIAEKLLYNKLIEHISTDEHMLSVPTYKLEIVTVPLREATPDELLSISRNRAMFLDLNEMQSIQQYYRKLGRDPTDVELDTIAILWSEHCSHKTFRGRIELDTPVDGKKVIDNLLKTYIMRATEEIAHPRVLSAFKDNAGIFALDDRYGVAVKVETHNHPSALEPYGGAATGIGGVIRDILGAGLGAKPIANIDVFLFGPLELQHEELPPGVLHPRRIAKGVVSGVRDYGNKMGIPTVNGTVIFHPGYVTNPVVYCGCVGVIPRDKIHKQVQPGDVIVLVGGRTGRDGIHGATFSSGEMDTSTEAKFMTAVQLGDPITEKKLQDALLVARDRGLYRAITDCGAGGIATAVVELGKYTGAEVELNRVPLKYEGLTYREIWIAESQERMVLAVPPDKVDELVKVFQSYNSEATPIGKFRSDGKIILKYDGKVVGELHTKFIFEQQPLGCKKAILPKCVESPHRTHQYDSNTIRGLLLKMLASPFVASKDWVVRQYDHEVQGGSVIKPLYGDAAVITPWPGTTYGIAIGCGINPLYSIHPYKMAQAAVDEAVRQIVAVGGNPNDIVLLDNFSWGNPEDHEKLGALVLTAKGLYDAAKKLGTPFISGKDSLHNEFRLGDKSISIPHTLLVTAIGIVEDINYTVTMGLKHIGNSIGIVGLTRGELGGSLWAYVENEPYGIVPTFDGELAKRVYKAVHELIQQGIIVAAHDVSEGGIGVTVVEMAQTGQKGATIDIDKIPHDGELQGWELLFSESNSRVVVEIAKGKEATFLGILAKNGVPGDIIGEVIPDSEVKFIHNGELLFSVPPVIPRYPDFV